MHPIRLILAACVCLALAAPAAAQRGFGRRSRAAPAPAPAAAPTSSASLALLPDSVLTPPGGPKLIHLSAPGSGLTALRVSIPIEEAPSEGGAAQILALLGLEKARSAAVGIGARVEGSRTPWGISYTVVGASEDFDYLAFILRSAVSEPRLDMVDFERARRMVREEAERLRETASGRLAADLRAAAVPGSRPLVGTPESLGGLNSSVVRSLWSRTHRRRAMSLVVVGPEPVELVLASLKDIGSADRLPNAAPIGSPPAAVRGRVEVLRNWYGEAWTAGDALDPRSAIAAALVAGRLREAQSGLQTDVQLWDVGRERVLAITGTAYPVGAAAMRRRVSGVLAETATRLAREDVAPVVAALRFDLLAAARTPWGLAAQVGRYHDATGEADGAYRQLLALERVDVESVRSYLRELQAKGPVRSEVRP